MSLCPSISGVALRIRSIRAWTPEGIGLSIGWAVAGVGISMKGAASSGIVLKFMGQSLGTALQRRNRAGKKPPMADLEESMRFDPDEGIADLDTHLDRLKSAAEAQGFRFARLAALSELRAATVGKRHRAIARLLLSPTGAMAIEVKAED